MEQRRAARHLVSQVPGLARGVQVLGAGRAPLETALVDLSAIGLRVAARVPVEPPFTRGEQLELLVSPEQLKLRAMCVHQSPVEGGGTALGLFVHGPFDQARLRQLLAAVGCEEAPPP